MILTIVFFLLAREVPKILVTVTNYQYFGSGMFIPDPHQRI
jgi:hypothetical protein